MALYIREDKWYVKQPKNRLNMNILYLLKKHIDENYQLSQEKMMEILERKYDMEVKRKAGKRSLMNLIDYVYNIEYNESMWSCKKGEDIMKAVEQYEGN